jgi:hypothetical protein
VRVSSRKDVFAARCAGYALAMTDSQTSETKSGPANPQTEGAVAATPPGGPLRQDGPSREVHGGHDDDASASPTNDRHAEESGGHTIAVEEEQSHPHPASEEDDVQEENAETSLDQPSAG